MYFVERSEGGGIVALYGIMQPEMDEETETLPADDSEVLAFLNPAPAPQTYTLYKSVFIRRLTSEEAETMEAVLAGADAKLRLMFNSVEYFVSDDPLFATLLAAVGVALGEERAYELLAPEQWKKPPSLFFESGL